MKIAQIVPTWGMILTGRRPFLSIEVTRECPLRCPGRYAGGEPLVRHRELDALLPRLAPTEVQLVTSAVRPIPPGWAGQHHLHIVVSVDGLPPEHDRRRQPATYERILANIAGHGIIIHCTVTSRLMHRPGYLRDFPPSGPSAQKHGRSGLASLPLYRAKGHVSRGAAEPGGARAGDSGPGGSGLAVPEGSYVQHYFGRVHFRRVRALSPASGTMHLCAGDCLSADLETEIGPCELGVSPECRECGCMASAGLAAIGRYRLAGLVEVGDIFRLSSRIGEARRRRAAECEAHS